ncbi:MAG TPA: thiamine pyrophosphate-dependent dehydrogenase E1 component subunit alpha [Ktedonobacteraceae bacterium]|nr:thiamine pyrophosphate-dependent dehydrogenase E1 component subunit alpha [Ktedonobacteraceae bacterium]
MSEQLSGLPLSRLLSMLRAMYRIRAFEEKVDELFMRGEMHGTTHLSIGQEGTAVGAISTLRNDDFITSTHRGHGHCIAKGADIALMMAELLGKETGYCRGRGGSMHIADVETGNLGANGIVAGGMPIATGVALSMKMQRSDRICLCIFGDGAANEGAFHESINLAAVWDLPVVFLCENNQYGMSMATRRAMRNETVAQRAAGYGIPGERVDGNNVLAVYAAVSVAVQRARDGQGPSLIESLTYRYKGHAKSDQNLYRTRDEIREWQKRDPIQYFVNLLIAGGKLDQAGAKQEEAAAYAAVEEAYQFALGSADPDPETLLEGVYA